MLVNQLSHQADHAAWQQRVNREFADIQGQITDGTMQSFHGGSTASCWCSSNYITPFTRLNRDQRDKKQYGFYLNDSTYNNASDPNSMRDQGMVRNAPYNIQYYQQCPPLKSARNYSTNGFSDRSRPITASFHTSVGPKHTNVKPNLEHNHTFYSFGGKTPIRSSYSSNRKPHVNMAFTSVIDFHQQEKPQVLHPHQLVRVQDYTKNISQSIFSPGFSQPTKLDIRELRKDEYRIRKEPRKAMRSLQKELSMERQRTKNIKKEVVEGLKEMMVQLKTFSQN
ncbi:UNKNOWN [Stylonychia lemnae]|uniref:Uncharacterized protein n=1 Tax=Stylonychia lemnae TaxID=5949 RepID=A0A078A9B8_STYLE|nr:UNKNOWN [Stylonychia lemnae]|eukprot:CDW78824.1 UNKNOWN [Stylonychia lemnae]